MFPGAGVPVIQLHQPLILMMLEYAVCGTAAPWHSTAGGAAQPLQQLLWKERPVDPHL